MEDKYYYKIRQVQADLKYLRAMLKESENGIITSEDKKKICRILLADILNDSKAIQVSLGTEFIPEF